MTRSAPSTAPMSAPHARRATRGPATLLVLASLLASLAACGSDAPHSTPGGHGAPTAPAPSWLHLVELYEPDASDLPRELARTADWSASLEAIDGEAWLVVDIEPSAWTASAIPGLYAAPSPLPPSMVDLDQQVFLTCDEQDLTRMSLRDGRAYDPTLTNAFGLLGGEVVVRRGQGVAAPRHATLRARAPLGRPDGSRWRVESGRFSGDGFVVLPGDAQSFVVPAGEDRRLSFGHFVSEPMDLDDEVELVVKQDGAVLWSRTVGHAEVDPDGHFDAGFVALADTDRATTLEFSASGPFCFCGFTSPVVGPDLGDAAPGEALDGRPNVVLFVADTFRADNLVDYRMLADAPEDAIVHPALERLVERSVRFHNSWAASTWTLPSHASMFASMLPLQHRALEQLTTLPQQAHVVAEVMRAAGYRTAAVTDGVYLKPTFGLAQGFEEFDQISVDAPRPLDRARALLERGDGRPSFLLVHTYYPHSPFQPTASARAAIGFEGGPPNSDALIAEVLAELEASAGAEDLERPEGCATLERLYRAQIVDFDREFASWMERFDDLGWNASTHLLFTSDHGEAFGDHGHFGHAGLPWESQARVPLLWSGPNVAPGVRTDPASGIDLAPTIAAVAGVAPSGQWQGRDLTEVRDGGHVWGSKFWVQRDSIERIEHERSFLTDGRFKLHTLEDGDAPYAFDLERDPDELVRLERGDPRWPTELDGVLADELEGVETALLPVTPLAHPSEDTLGALRAMGYLGDD